MESPNRWPNTITSRRHHHSRRRAEAYASALYYSECHSSGISPDGAAAAEEHARSRHSRWWLKGNDPKHPSTQGHGYGSGLSAVGAKEEVDTSCDDAKASSEEENPKPNHQGLDQVETNNDGDSRTDDENDSVVAEDIQEEEEDGDEQALDLEDDDSNIPILARDDDLGSSFGTLSSFCTSSNSQNTSPSRYNGQVATNTAVIVGTQNQSNPTAVSAMKLPSWLTGPSRTGTATAAPSVAVVSPPQVVIKREEGSTEEMLNSYFASSPSQLLTQEKKQDGEDPLSKKSPQVAVAAVAQVTSEESEADDSIGCDSSSSSAAFYPKPRLQHVESGSYHGVGVATTSRKRIRDDFSSSLDQTFLDARIESAKANLLSRLENEGMSLAFRKSLASLEKFAKLKKSACGTSKKRKLLITPVDSVVDSRSATDIDGTWHMISPPEYPGEIKHKKNAQGEILFTLGRMSFDMFNPSNLVCSIQKQYNTIASVEKKDLPLYVPKSLRREVDSERDGGLSSGRLKTYNIIASFTIETQTSPQEDAHAPQDQQSKKKLRGILTNYGYALPDPTSPDRKSIWFTGGTIEPADDDSLDEWKAIFGATTTALEGNTTGISQGKKNQSTLVEEAKKARTLASKILLGAVHEPIDNQGIVGFHLNKPIGGHGSAYCDVIYLDDELRIMRGHSGSIYVFKRV